MSPADTDIHQGRHTSVEEPPEDVRVEAMESPDDEQEENTPLILALFYYSLKQISEAIASRKQELITLLLYVSVGIYLLSVFVLFLMIMYIFYILLL